ncbi:MAG: hypothetical protein ACRC4W_02320 [Treponemataceae bacterium]
MEIKYIATHREGFVICDIDKIKIVSENGHVFNGYKPHICTGIKNEKDEKI